MIPIQAGDVHIWHNSLDVSAMHIAKYQQSLSPDERERANRYVMPIHRTRFSVGRGILRDVLSRYTGLAPDELMFTYGGQGKPELKQIGDIRFNIAHSEDRLVIGITYRHLIGTDIEKVRHLPDMDQLSKRFLPSLAGIYRYEGSSTDQRTAFFQRWTLTEALLKATGIGISNIQKLEEPDLEQWTICQIDAPPGFIAALAVEGQINQIIRMEL